MGLGFEILTRPEGLTDEEWDRKICEDMAERGLVRFRTDPARAADYAPTPMPKLKGSDGAGSQEKR